MKSISFLVIKPYGEGVLIRNFCLLSFSFILLILLSSSCHGTFAQTLTTIPGPDNVPEAEPASPSPPDVPMKDGSTQEYWCRDSSCLGPISVGRTLLLYNAPTHRHLSFRGNQDIVILAKPIEDGDYWVGKVLRNGRAGLIPKNLIREERILPRKEQHNFNLDLILLFTSAETPISPEESVNTDSNPTSEGVDEKIADEVKPKTEEEVTSSLPAEETSEVPEEVNADVTEAEKDADPSSVNTLKPSTEGDNLSTIEGQGSEHTEKQKEETNSESNIETEKHDHYEGAVGSDSEDDKQLPVEEESSSSVDNAAEEVVEAASGSSIAAENGPQGDDSTEEVPVADDHASTESSPEVHESTSTENVPEADDLISAQNVPPTNEPSHPSIETDPETDDSIASEHENDEEEDLDVTTQSNLEIDDASKENEPGVEDSAVLAEDIAPQEVPTKEDLAEDVSTAKLEEALQSSSEDAVKPADNVNKAQHPQSTEALSNNLEQEAEVKNEPKQDKYVEDEAIPSKSNEQEEVVGSTTSADKDDVNPVDLEESVTVDTSKPPPNSEIQYLVDDSTDKTSEEPKPVPTENLEVVSESTTTAPYSDAEIDSSLYCDKDSCPTPVNSLEPPLTHSPEPVSEDSAGGTVPTSAEIDEGHAHVSSTTNDELSPDTTFINDTEPASAKEDVPDREIVEELTSEESQSKNNSLVMVIKYLSATLLSFLPEHLQDTILDVNDALIFTGIISLLIISICVPYFFLQAFLSSRPLKKKVVDLNKTLWKVSTAYENQQDEFEMFKKKAYAYDEDQKRIEQLELQLDLLKKMDQKQKDTIRSQKQQLYKRGKLEEEVSSLAHKTMNDLTKTENERDHLKQLVASLQSAIKSKVEELEASEAEISAKIMEMELLNNTKEHLENKEKVFEKEISELMTKVNSEVALRKETQLKLDDMERNKETLQDDLDSLRKIAHQYEETVNNLTNELSLKESELFTLKDSLGEDSPLVEISEINAKLLVSQEDTKSLQARVESITLENKGLKKQYEEYKALLGSVTEEKNQAETRFQVLEAYFKEKEEEYRGIVERQQVEQEIRGKDKNELIKLIQEKVSEINDLNERIEELKNEFEETKASHRTEVRTLEAKNHENWLSLCQSERKAQDAKKEAELLRQKLTQIVKDRNDDDTLLDGEDFYAPIIPLDMVPPPLSVEEISPSYFGLGTDFMPPPPLPLDGEDESNPEIISAPRRAGDREPHRPPPVGRISPNDSDGDMSNMLSPIERERDMARGARCDYSDGSSSPTGRPLSRDSWMNGTSGNHNNFNNNNNKNSQGRTDQRRRHPNQGPQKTSSPIDGHGSSLC